jgi:hypothetical protein
MPLIDFFAENLNSNTMFTGGPMKTSLVLEERVYSDAKKESKKTRRIQTAVLFLLLFFSVKP